jgi:phosphate transport system substrate-binding protein
MLPDVQVGTHCRFFVRALRFVIPASMAVVVTLAAGCGGGGSKGGTITADGSSTVAPYMTAAAEEFKTAQPDVRITVAISGTGGGFERFCRGETDISDASRPIKDEEKAICEENGIEYVAFQIANDALSIIVNKANDWAQCLTVAELKKIWEPGSKVDTWSEAKAAFPDEPLKLFGPGTDSGTFDYFTDVINGEEGASRSDYSASEDDNVIVQGVAGEKGGLGYLGFSYYDENRERLRAVEVDGGDGCVAPSAAAAQDGTYKPLSRPLFVYVKQSSFERKEIEDLVGYILDHEKEIAARSDFISLNDEQLARAKADFQRALAEVNA